MSEILADEIIAASKGSGSGANSFAVKKKDEIERVAKGNRWLTRFAPLISQILLEQTFPYLYILFIVLLFPRLTTFS